MESLLAEKYGAENITSTTLPGLGEKNVHLGTLEKPHPMTCVPFDQRGFANFEKEVIFDTRIPSKMALLENPAKHKAEATNKLREQIIKGFIKGSDFSEKQLQAIMLGKESIPALTWHHHQDLGRMQLISRELHAKTGHVGGNSMWSRWMKDEK